MSDRDPVPLNRAETRSAALSRWDNEGGAGLGDSRQASGANELPSAPAEPGNTDLAQLHSRVIALENVMIALLSHASERQLDLVRDMSTCISPRPGAAHHPLTIHAAAQMLQLVERARHFRGLEGSTSGSASEAIPGPADPRGGSQAAGPFPQEPT